jgi:hypothetical protein
MIREYQNLFLHKEEEEEGNGDDDNGDAPLQNIFCE